MAYSSTIALKSVFGNARIAILSCVADGVSGSVSGGGVAYLFSAMISPISMATAAPLVKINTGSMGTSLVGTVNFNGLVAGDVFYLMLYGRS